MNKAHELLSVPLRSCTTPVLLAPGTQRFGDPLRPAIRAADNASILPLRQGGFGLEDGLLLIEELEKQQPGEMLHIFHDTATVVVAAHDVAGTPDVVCKLLSAHAVSSRYRRCCISCRVW